VLIGQSGYLISFQLLKYLMKRFKIFSRLFFSHTTIALFSLLVLSAIFYETIRTSLIQRTIDQLSSINVLKKNQIESRFKDIEADFKLLLNTEYEINSADERLAAISHHYGFKSMSFITSEGQKIFALGNEPTLVVPKAAINMPSGSFIIVDASVETPSLLYCLSARMNNATVYLLARENFEAIQQQLQVLTGMGSTGESYLVANDFRMRSASRFFSRRNPLSIPVKTVASKSAMAGNSGGDVIDDYRNVKVVSYYRLLAREDLRWAIISEIDLDEAMMPILQLRNYLILVTIAIVFVVLIVTYFVSNAIAKPVLQLKNVITILSQGAIPGELIMSDRRDEIGDMMRSVQALVQRMKNVTDFANKIGSGDFEASFNSTNDQDVLGHALINMRDQLRTLNENEVRLVREKTAAVLEGQENERKRIIRDLHDGVGQLLTAISLNVDGIKGNEELKSELSVVINDTIAEVKRISYNVMPNTIVDFGLEAALRGLCNNVKRYSNVTYDFRFVRDAEHDLDFDISISVFRIVQEGLNNMMKHAGATHFDLHVIMKEDEIYLLLRDNGKSFRSEDVAAKGGFGLNSIKERAMLLEGVAEIHSSPGVGTTIEAHIPIK
jgi:two-component system NarL family sensor kinase